MRPYTRRKVSGLWVSGRKDTKEVREVGALSEISGERSDVGRDQGE
jgi:hypothetical protein